MSNFTTRDCLADQSDGPSDHRVLFVDDDNEILQGLERMMFSCDTEWDFDFACGGAEALKKMTGTEYQVVISDMRMPGIDGPALLKRIAAEHPDTLRVALSGHTELAAALRAIPVAHQFISKPCLPGSILEVMDRCIEMRHLVQDPEVRAAAGSIESLPPRPKVYGQIVDILANPDASVNDIATLVESDVGVATKLLHASNNAYFNRGRQIMTARHAVSFLGPAVVRDLVLSIEVTSAFGGAGAAELERMSRHSFRVAEVAEAIALPEFKEVAYTAGLLHDVGALVLAANGIRDRDELHGRVGAFLLGLWGLPHPVLEAAAFHDDLHKLHVLDVLGSVILAGAAVSGRLIEPSQLTGDGVAVGYAKALKRATNA